MKFRWIFSYNKEEMISLDVDAEQDEKISKNVVHPHAFLIVPTDEHIIYVNLANTKVIQRVKIEEEKFEKAPEVVAEVAPAN